MYHEDDNNNEWEQAGDDGGGDNEWEQAGDDGGGMEKRKRQVEERMEEARGGGGGTTLLASRIWTKEPKPGEIAVKTISMYNYQFHTNDYFYCID